MREHHRAPRRLLRWYPAAWQARYGDEFLKLIEDTLQSGRPTARFRLSIALAGLRQRALTSGLFGDSGPPAETVRTGSIIIFCAWTAFVFAGASFSKLSQHFVPTIPLASRALPVAAYDITAACGAVGAGLVVAAAIIALPSFVRLMQNDGWNAIKINVFRAATATAILAVSLLLLSFRAHRLSPYQRNGGDGLYSLAFVGWALLFAVALSAWARTVVNTTRRLTFAPRTLRVESALAQLASGSMAAATMAAAAWCVAMAVGAPQFLYGIRLDNAAAHFDPRLAVTILLMLIAAITSSYGVVRIRAAFNKTGNSMTPTTPI